MSFKNTFENLKSMLTVCAGSMDIKTDTADCYSLDTRHVMKNGKPLFFGSVVINKSYVSFHLMPVYVFPELLDGMSATLKKRMQGKSCFNFKEIDEADLADLKDLVRNGLEKYKTAAYV